MKRYLIYIIAMTVCCSSLAAEQSVSIIPLPHTVEMRKGLFEVTPDTVILADGDAVKVGGVLKELLAPATGCALKIKNTEDMKSNFILLSLEPDNQMHGDEGYDLDVTTKSIVIRAARPAGLFYGVQTLRQLLPPDIEADSKVEGVKWVIQAVKVVDKPRFKWRGMHLDVGRHMFPIEYIKKFIDLLALHKMNTFHWHLTEDQGWRIEIKKYPRLTEIGSMRASSPYESYNVRVQRRSSDGKPYGGYYTQKQVREIVAYATDRYVNVVPEIEMPGHCLSALASYPELGCTGGPYQVRTKWGISSDVFCVGNEKTFEFLEGVLKEVFELFPGKIIHIGGDECPTDRWEQCPKCQKRVKDEGMNNAGQLQSYFISRMNKFINKHGRTMIGWDEILRGGLDRNVVVMCWRFPRIGVGAAKGGYKVVMSARAHCYFDFLQGDDAKDLASWNRVMNIKKVYANNPTEGLPAEFASNILGTQANVWTENIRTPEKAEYMTYPRGSALAEVAWSVQNKRNFNDFMKRLNALLPRLKVMGVNYRDPAKDSAFINQQSPTDDESGVDKG